MLFLAAGTSGMHLEELRSKAQTKKELWLLLSHDVGAYLPDCSNTSV
jgi:hypothetical protein